MKDEIKNRINLVPCNGCVACCQGDAVFMHPEWGDDETQYKTEMYNGRVILAHKKNRDCIYLNRQTGCTIYDRRPMICRELDCRVLLKLPKDMKRLASKSMLRAAKRMTVKLRFKK